ncbi:hypothetical protein ACTVZO_44565 [Streptomyces sp. IBSNAI002]|uniref:hypothetical protein n=1 Tax=Streptomyces sp. IBSNAI002 TaxID=3457500 RepID=UPI003FD43E80
MNCKNDAAILRAAIAAAAPGSRLEVRGRCIGPFTIDKDLSLTGRWGAVLDGNHQDTTITVNGNVRVYLESLSIVNGAAKIRNPGPPGADGGGIRNNGGNVTVTRSTVHHNTAAFGGGISNEGIGTMRLTATNVHHNTAAGRGGGVFNLDDAELTLLRSAVHDNTAGGIGGGFHNDGSLVLSDTKVYGNSAGSGGGGIYAEDGTATLTGATVVRNTVGQPDGQGGGIFVREGVVTLRQSLVRRNQPDNCAPPGAVPGCTG